jgi:hypothetical protein
MRTTQKPFDWRAFWADLLQGTGRALLTLDDSDEARAAMAGLDHFDAAQRRRAEQLSRSADDEAGAPPAGSDADGSYVRLDLPSLGFGNVDDVSAHEPEFFSSAMMPPHLRNPSAIGLRKKPIPMSANQYDLVELPAVVNFRTGGLPVIRRR